MHTCLRTLRCVSQFATRVVVNHTHCVRSALTFRPFPLQQERAPQHRHRPRPLVHSHLRGRIETRSLRSCLLLTANDGNERRDRRTCLTNVKVSIDTTTVIEMRGVDGFSAAVADVLCAIVYMKSVSAPNASNNMTRPNQLRIISCVVYFGNGDVCFVSNDQTVCLIRNEVRDSDVAAVEGTPISRVRLADTIHFVAMSCIPSQLQTDNTDSCMALLSTDTYMD